MRASITTLFLLLTSSALAQEQVAAPAPADIVADARWRVHSGPERGWAVAAPGSPRYLLSAAHLFTRGARVRVRRQPLQSPEGESENAPGEWVRARVVRVDPETGLALLYAEGADHSGSVRPADAVVGAYTRILSDPVVETTVAAVVDSQLALSVPCASGAALLSREGGLVGICIGFRRAAPASALPQILAEESELETPRAWRFSLQIEGFARMQQGLRATFGTNFGVRAVGYDRLGFELRAGLAGLARDDENTFGRGASGEITAELQLHQSFRLGVARGRFIFGLGATYRTQQNLVSTSFVEVDPMCDLSGGRCPGNVIREDALTTSHHFLPSLRFAIELEAISFSYTALIDVETPANTTHSIGLGVSF